MKGRFLQESEKESAPQKTIPVLNKPLVQDTLGCNILKEEAVCQDKSRHWGPRHKPFTLLSTLLFITVCDWTPSSKTLLYQCLHSSNGNPLPFNQMMLLWKLAFPNGTNNLRSSGIETRGLSHAGVVARCTAGSLEHEALAASAQARGESLASLARSASINKRGKLQAVFLKDWITCQWRSLHTVSLKKKSRGLLLRFYVTNILLMRLKIYSTYEAKMKARQVQHLQPRTLSLRATGI